MMRAGSCTASRFKDIMTKPREKGAFWSKTAESYMIEKVTELRICAPLDNFTSAPTRWGTEWEEEAFKAAIPVVEKLLGKTIEKPEGKNAFIEHPTEPYIGCSPDGIIGEEGLLECKCPYNAGVHTATILAGEMPEKHEAQTQGALWITNRKFYIFASFDPRVRASGADPLFWVRVERDEEYIQELAERVIKFRDWVLETYARITPNHAPF